MLKGSITKRSLIGSDGRQTRQMQVSSSEQALMAEGISLRRVRPEDEDLLLEIYASTRAEEMALVPWSEEQIQIFVSSQFAAQQWHYTQKYPNADHSIITKNGRDVGRIFLARLERKLHIADITVLPEARNAGIGRLVIGDLISEAEEGGKAVTVYVETFNPSLRLFERLGFRQIEQQGTHLLLEWSAQ